MEEARAAERAAKNKLMAFLTTSIHHTSSAGMDSTASDSTAASPQQHQHNHNGFPQMFPNFDLDLSPSAVAAAAAAAAAAASVHGSAASTPGHQLQLSIGKVG